MNQNQTFTDKHLASLAAIMLLAPAVSFMLKEKSIDVDESEEGYIRSYIRYGYWILMVLALAFVIWGTYTLFFPISVLYWINYGLLGAVIAMIVVGVFSIINNKTLIERGQNAEQHTEANASVLVYFIPLYNYYLWYNETLDQHNYRWVKESVLWWSLYLIIISIFPISAVIFLGLFIILARAIMLTVGMDFISNEAKKKINNWFYHNIEEFIAYPLGIVTHIVKKVFQKTSTLHSEIDNRKLTYAERESVKHPRTIISYLIVLAALGYRGYVAWLASGPTLGVNFALLPQIIWL